MRASSRTVCLTPRIATDAASGRQPPYFVMNFGREEKNCQPSPHRLDLSRLYGFSYPPGCADLLRHILVQRVPWNNTRSA